MATQSLNSSTLEADRRQQVPERNELGASPLGSVGNLQYSVEQGGTAPAPRAGAPLSEMNQPLADRRANLNADVTGESSQARAQRQALTEARAEVRANGLLIGNLLGSLTAKVDEEGRFVDAMITPESPEH
ncbi:hypothetical protein [Alcaligenes sp. Marseille-Q7550]